MVWHIAAWIGVFVVWISCIKQWFYLYYTDFFTNFTLMLHFLQFTRIFLPNRKYRVIIVSKPKILCNIVWTLKKILLRGGREYPSLIKTYMSIWVFERMIREYMSIWEDDKRVYGGEGLFSTVRMVGRLLREIWGETMPWFAFYTPTTSSPIRLCMYNVHVTLKNSQWRKIKQMKPMRLCVVYWNLWRNNTPAFPFIHQHHAKLHHLPM